MNVIIIEDGPTIARTMEKYIEAFNPKIFNVIKIISSVEEGIEYFENHQMPDLIFSDIELTDGLCFEIFKDNILFCPIIFTTSYNEYWQKAFKTNSIDYLLKPITKEKIHDSMNFFIELKEYYQPENENKKLIKFVKELKSENDKFYKGRFLLKMGAKYNLVIVNEIKYLYSSDKLSYFITKNDEQYSTYESLRKIELKLDPRKFFRINRKTIVNIDFISMVKPFFKGKLVVIIQGNDEELMVSQNRANKFRKWLNI